MKVTWRRGGKTPAREEEERQLDGRRWKKGEWEVRKLVKETERDQKQKSGKRKGM